MDPSQQQDRNGYPNYNIPVQSYNPNLQGLSNNSSQLQPQRSIGSMPHNQNIRSQIPSNGINLSNTQDNSLYLQQQQAASLLRSNSGLYQTHGMSMNAQNGYSNLNNNSMNDVVLLRRGALEGQQGFDARYTNMGLTGLPTVNNNNAFGQQVSQHSSLIGGNISSFDAQVHQQMEEFVLQNDDFPALPRASNQSQVSQESSISNSSHQSQSSHSNDSIGQQVLSGFGGMIKSYLPTDSSQSQVLLATNSDKSNMKYGLLGLLDILRVTDKDTSALALGTDLTLFGLNLSSSECSYMSFNSPFSEQPSNESQFTTPPYYLIPQVANMKIENFPKFQIETLFYLFYTMPKDVYQVAAAQELYRREWRYHGELRVWFKQRSSQEILQSQPNIQYIYFDINSWEARLFTSQYRGNLGLGFLSDEDIKPKGVATSQSTPNGIPVYNTAQLSSSNLAS